MRYPWVNEDAKNLSVITGSALVAVAITAGLLVGRAAPVRHHMEVVTVREAPPALIPLGDLGPVTGSNRLYGRVVTRDGSEHTGYIRWDRNEGSWTDLLDANKLRHRASATQSGIRFGHVHRIESAAGDEAVFTLKSGEQVRMGARATDLGNGLRALLVEHANAPSTELGWRDLDFIEFQPAPESELAGEARLYGTLVTRSGLEFTGYVTWDVDEIYSTDILDGEADGRDMKIPFGAIASIERNGSSAARVELRDGKVLVLRGTNDVNESNGGISVSDVGLGQVKVDWDEFDVVRFQDPGAELGFGYFDGGHALRGTVVTEDGVEISGDIAWDNDETRSWEMLNGELAFGGEELQVEFGQIARILKTRRGALVDLLDGRSFELEGSNDVDEGNRGITISTDDGRTIEVEWDEFQELRLER